MAVGSVKPCTRHRILPNIEFEYIKLYIIELMILKVFCLVVTQPNMSLFQILSHPYDIAVAQCVECQTNSRANDWEFSGLVSVGQHDH